MIFVDYFLKICYIPHSQIHQRTWNSFLKVIYWQILLIFTQNDKQHANKISSRNHKESNKAKHTMTFNDSKELPSFLILILQIVNF